eukprot:240649-Amorphochlora_amoeboformis.AAC.1
MGERVPGVLFMGSGGWVASELADDGSRAKISARVWPSSRRTTDARITRGNVSHLTNPEYSVMSSVPLNDEKKAPRPQTETSPYEDV